VWGIRVGMKGNVGVNLHTEKCWLPSLHLTFPNTRNILERKYSEIQFILAKPTLIITSGLSDDKKVHVKEPFVLFFNFSM
jgi:hypothetical protein